MRRTEAEKLLGGHATGTLTAEERRTLFEAALAHQDLFDTLMDEEALRELLADPAARAQVLAALAALAPSEAAAPKVVPFWRRPGVLGAAAGVLMASLAGLTWLRNPQAPPPARQAPASPKTLSFEAPSEAPAEPDRERRAPTPPPPPGPKKAPAPEAALPPAADSSAAGAAPMPAAAAPVPVPMPAHIPRSIPVVRENAQDKAQDAAGKVAGAPPDRPAPQAVVEVLSTASQAPARAKAARVEAKAEGRSSGAPAPELPTWTLTPQPDGTTLVTVTVPPQAQVWLLKRGDGGVEVLQERAAAFKEDREAQRRYQVRLRAGDALDLYVTPHSVADPAKLPETGPVAGFRARIFPAE